MIKFNLNSITEQQKGVIYIALGFVLLLYVLNLFQFWLNIVVFLIAAGLMAYGAYRMGILTVISGGHKKRH